MSLFLTIEADIVTAMKEKRERELAILRILKSAVKNAEIEKRGALDDAGVIEVARREVKKLKDSLTQFELSARADVIAATKGEIAILEKYLPAAPSEEEIETMVKGAIAHLGAHGPQDAGKVMGLAMKELKGRVDGGAVKRVVEELLRGS